MLCLKLWKDGHVESEIRLDKARTYEVGRSSSAGIRVDDPKVSRRHCRLLFGVRGWHVQDLSSTNGTFLNDERIERADIHPGDRLVVGGHVLEAVEVAEPAAPAPPAAPVAPPTTPGQAICCDGCGKLMPADAPATGRAVIIDGKTWCLLCSVRVQRESAATDDAGNELFSLLRDFENRKKPQTPGGT